MIALERREGFFFEIRLEQLLDDMEDIREDEKTQINPFVALLKSHDLFDKYLKGEIDIMSYNDEDGAFKRDRKIVYNGYWEMVDYAEELIGVKLVE